MRSKGTEVPAKDVWKAERIDATSAERGGKEPKKPRSNCARKTSSASGRENVRGQADANLNEQSQEENIRKAEVTMKNIKRPETYDASS
jgi:hypothetical protein